MNYNNNQSVIAKFGGSSVADYVAMSNSAQIVMSDQNVRVVVLSASAGITNLLIACSDPISIDQRLHYLDQIRAIQYQILSHLHQEEQVKQEIDLILSKIMMLSEAANLATSPALTDELVSYGEIMSTRLFTELLRQNSVDAVWFDVRNVMITDSHFGKAQVDTCKMRELCQVELVDLLKEHVVVTQGFIGRDSDNRTTTLGRGGSDYTAALLGEALQVRQIDIWTDVPGIYTTDPRVVSSAKKIDEISFAETAEMATFGAKILHPATLIPAVSAGIPVFVGSSKQPKAGGTIVSHHASESPAFRAIAVRRRQTLLTLHSLTMLHAHGFLAEVFNILAKHKIGVDLITTSEVRVALTLDTTGSSTGDIEVITPQLLEALSQLGKVEVETDLALVAIIGNRLEHTAGISHIVFSALDDFAIRMACFGASTHNICLLVAAKDADNVTQALHHKLFD